jgi:hypothetical protein
MGLYLLQLQARLAKFGSGSSTLPTYQHDDIFIANHPGCVLPMRPGKYKVYITTFRVFDRDHAMTTYSGKGIAVTSENILTVEVVK